MDESPSGQWSVQQLRSYSDERGTLIPLEAGRDVPFPIERVYYLRNTAAGAERGFHAHRTLQQFAVAVSGSCTFVLDDGEKREQLRLDSADAGVFIDAMVWHEMRDFSTDCVLLVLASGPFDESDYIRDYSEFRRHAEALQPR